MLRLRGKFILKRDPLKFFAEVSDLIFGLLAVKRRHESCNGIRAVCRAYQAAFG
jgi:hypothetical protein